MLEASNIRVDALARRAGKLASNMRVCIRKKFFWWIFSFKVKICFCFIFKFEKERVLRARCSSVEKKKKSFTSLS